MNRLRILLLLSLVVLSGCASTRSYVDSDRHSPAPPVPASELEYEVFLIGNTGAGDTEASAPTLRALRQFLDNASQESAVVFLGDQFEGGMPDSASADRQDADRRLELIVEALDDYDGRVFFIPGDQDWDGPESLRRQEDVIEDALDRDDIFLPGDARSGPVVLELTDDLVLIGLDTAWWLEDEPKPIGDAADNDDDEGHYEIANSGDIIFAVEDALKEYDDENILIVGHHPLRSNGEYGGQFTLGRHMVPLPVVGSAYPLFRQFAGTRQDMAHPEYRAYRTALEDVFALRDRLIYASAHDQSLQAFPFEPTVRYSQHYLVSGSGAEGAPVAKGRGAGLASSDRGFMRLQYLRDGSVRLDTYSVENDDNSPQAIYSDELYGIAPERVDPEIPEVDVSTLPSYADSTVVRAVEPNFYMGRTRSTILGTGYRQAWVTPAEFEVLDMSDYGGLEPIRKGGSGQTISLRLQGGDGHHYVLRLLRKYLGRNFAPELSESLGADILDDLSTATIPWAALAVSRLAEPAGVYHTNPRLVLIPDDPRLGVYREQFGDQLALFEERPNDDMSEFDNLGNSEDIVSTAKMMDEVQDDNDHRVDERFYARARLFDMLISDWDRHADQWRWATFEPFELDPTLEGDARTQGKIYRAIPRDRDYAFYRHGGLLPWVARQVEPKLQPFRESYGSLSGLTTTGIPLDRRFTTRLSRQDWIEIATSLRDSISDEDISAAFHTWPPEIFELYGTENIEILQARRDQLPEIAEEVYRLHAHAVDVAGSDKHERFEVTGFDDGTVEVVIMKTNREGELRNEIYRRTFYPNETAEIRLYGLGGHDQFIINGADHGAINVRMIGGSGRDRVENPIRRSTTFYDTIQGNDVSLAGRADVILSDDPANNRYEPEDYSYPRFKPSVSPGYRSTDGVVLNGSLTFHRSGFRRHPWAFTHNIWGSFATRTLGVRGGYSLRLYDAFGENWDVALSGSGSSVRYVNNFYGFGNETVPTTDVRSFNYVGLAEVEGGASVIRRVEQSIELTLGAGAAYRNVEEDSTRFISTPAAGLSPSDFDGAVFATGFAELDLNAVDNAINPRQGFKWGTRARLFGGISGSSSTFASVGSDLALYFSPKLERQITVSGRAGIGHIFGTFPFYEAQTLGDLENVRGLRRNRYSGRTVAYQNVETRIELVNAISKTFPITIGMLGFLDNGRVWADGESSSVWHQSYGGGLWFNVLDLSVMTASLAHGDDGYRFDFGMNFFY